MVREEGSNGDREMSVSLYMAGFEVAIQSFVNWIYVDLSCVAGVHDSFFYMCLCRCGMSPCKTCALAP